MPGAGKILWVPRGDVVESEVEKDRVVDGTNLRVVVSETYGMAAGDPGHGGRALVREVRAVDQSSVARSVHSGHVEVYREVEIPELGRHCLEAGWPVWSDGMVKRALA